LDVELDAADALLGDWDDLNLSRVPVALDHALLEDTVGRLGRA
jgi:hypothetical protein